MDQVAGMAFFGKPFHQPVLAELPVHPESQPNRQGTGRKPEENANEAVCSGKVQGNHREQHSSKPSRKEEEVACRQPFELHPLPDAFVNRIFHLLEEEGTQDGGRYNQEDAGEEPACRGLRGVRVPAGELAVGLDAAYQSEHRTDSIAEFGRRIKIAGHEAGCLVDAGKPFALRENVGHRYGGTQYRKKDSFSHGRIVFSETSC